jgi:pSer/pThr/pTyr-binding forkhead associated (FHA) protein
MHCPECGFANAEGANYCQKCGAFLGDQTEQKSGDTTEVYQVDETGELRPVDLEEMTHEGAALVIRSGGGRSGEAFNLSGERNTIGRSPDAEVFLDDVTVSRNHAVLVERDGSYYVEDEGSLNGTFVNRHRIDSAKLENGDEVQIGKYRMTFVEGVG